MIGGEFGWTWDKTNDALDKANYAAVASMHNESFRETLTQVIKDQTGADEVEYLCQDSLYTGQYWSYIDHESYGICPKNYDELKSFIFNKNSWLFTGNDNTTAKPMFYDVPEYTSNGVIEPIYLYELSVQDYAEKVKYTHYPSQEEITDGLTALLESIRLYADSNDSQDYLFEKATNFYTSRPEYFEFTTYNPRIDFENNICYFVKQAYHDARVIYSEQNSDRLEYSNLTDEDHMAINKLEKDLLYAEDSKYKRAVKFFIEKIGG